MTLASQEELKRWRSQRKERMQDINTPKPANHLAPHNKSNWLWKAERAALEQYRRDILHINLLIWNHFDSKGQRKITASLLEGKRTGDLGKTQLHLEQGLFPALQSQLCRASGPESSQKPKGRHGSKRLSAAAFGDYVRMETSKEARLLELLPPLLGDNIDYPG
ncbi:PREDICTED: uncharacterized protein LOC108530965 [Rhinopithecus bieti]|uniref:uncharacterized protein LOC108530965 n=1 Tax=Rhinopithecus bieti TaxID=61621 RepID=UPI00083C3FAC|nr:PREDICTED: uncharacterized protein LOC108530965 [Rhinopithecus bieti]